MDWPTASVIIGVLGTIVAAVVKWPRSELGGNGRYYAKATDMAIVLTKLEGLASDAVELKEDINGVRKSMHDLRNDLQQYANRSRRDMGS